MKKSSYIKEIQKRLPDNILIEDETIFEFTEDEYVSILSWIKFFNEHYKEYGKDKNPSVLFPLISKRLRLDFGLYRFPSDVEKNYGEHVIYLTENRRGSKAKVRASPTVRELIATWNL